MVSNGLTAPEGTYVMAATYVLPPQPAFMTPFSGPSTMQPMSNAGGQTSGGAVSSQANASGQGPANAASASSVSMTASNSAQGGTVSNGGSASAANSSFNTAGTQTNGVAAGTSQNGTGEAGSLNLRVDVAKSHDSGTPKTVLSHISMQAPSAWSHVPILPPSKISVASVRHAQQSTVSSLPSVAGFAGRKDRQQASHTSTLASTAKADSLDGSNGSESDLGNVSVAELDGGKPIGGNGDLHAVRPHWGPILECSLASQGIDGIASHVTGGQGGLPGMAALQLLSHLGNGSSLIADGNNVGSSSGAVQTATSSSKNLPKPKNNIRQTSSSFVQRLQSNSELNKLLGPRADGMTIERHTFTSRGRMLFWLAETSGGWIKEPLARMTFAAPISTHDVNQQTRSPSRLDIIIGFTSSDLLWLEAVSMRYSRINKAGCINEAPITSVRWVPGSETLFISCHSDGTCTLFDVTRDDSAAGSWTPSSGLSSTTRQNADHVLLTGEEEADEELQEVLAHQIGDFSIDSTNGSDGTTPNRLPSVNAWDPSTSILITRPASAFAEGDAGRKQWSKLNPVAHWRVCRNVAIKDMAFSPDHTKLAIVSTDGMLRLVNLLTESLEGSFQSYYGALNRVVWSHDARFLLTAGCDDLISVWTNDGRLLSRCIGHSSFVTGLAFDPWKWRPEDRTYRFVSVGEDGRILLWDFSSAALHRPRMPHSAHSSQRRQAGIGGSGGSENISAHRRSSAVQDHHDSRNSFTDSKRPIYHSAQSRGEVAELQPVASYQFGPLTSTAPAESSATNLIAFSPPPLSPNTAAFPLHLDGNPSNGGISNAQTGSVASNVPNASSTPGNTGASASAVGTMNVFNSAAANNAANEPGAPNDLLVDVRCRPDGIVVVHKSGTLRYLLRPLRKATARAALSPLRAR
jgi:hypothetical protein